jgi:glycosyltransferase involved in cell wall biosynthesis
LEKKYKVFIGLREIAGYFSSLKKGFDESGVECAFLNLGGNKFNYASGKNPKWVSVFNYIGTNIGSKFSKNFILRFLWLVLFQNLFSFIAFFIAFFKYDVFIFGSNSTFFFFLELPILKLFKKKIIYVFLGTDSRPIYLNGYVYSGGANLFLMMLLTKIQKKVITIIEKYATVIINHPPQAYFHEKLFISSLMVGIPQEPLDKGKSAGINKTIRIIHIPSKAGPKGSIQFCEMINRLKEKYNIDYVEISGIPHNEVLNIIRGADFALDELYSDTPMAVFATECAFQGVPVIVGSYYAQTIQDDYIKAQLPPSMFVLPENVEKAIERLIIDTAYREELGRQAYNFVSINWSAKVVAEKYMQLIRGDFPKQWLYDPQNITYLYGCGLSQEQVKKNINSFVEKGSIKSLCLKDKPNLEDKYLKMVKG